MFYFFKFRLDSTGANFLQPPGGWAEKVFSVIVREAFPNNQGFLLLFLSNNFFEWT